MFHASRLILFFPTLGVGLLDFQLNSSPRPELFSSPGLLLAHPVSLECPTPRVSLECPTFLKNVLMTGQRHEVRSRLSPRHPGRDEATGQQAKIREEDLDKGRIPSMKEINHYPALCPLRLALHLASPDHPLLLAIGWRFARKGL